MINKEKFIDFMTRYKELCDKEEAVNNAIAMLCTDFNGIYLSYHHMLFLDMIKELAHDKNDRIFSYIYENNCGEDFQYDEEKELDLIDDFSKLYDFIKKENSERS